MSALSAFAITVLSTEQALDPENQVRNVSDAMAGVDTTMTGLTPRPTRSRRVTSYHNSFQTICTPDDSEPPSYTKIGRRTSPRRETNFLPPYSCTVSSEAKVWLNLELINPMHTVAQSEWREVFISIRGTILGVHRVKDGGMGKLLRTYTLQHAEVGLATDSSYTTYTPTSRLACLIPTPTRARAYQKDKRLFKQEKQHLLRVRLETDQLLFGHGSEQVIHNLVNTISAGIDIAQPIDDRSMTKQCTVPRRRRRNRQHFSGNIADPSLIADQERILRTMYPSLAANVQEQDVAQRGEQQAAAVEEEEIDTSAIREEEEEDTSVIREEEVDTSAIREEVDTNAMEELAAMTPTTARPGFSRSTTQTSIETRMTADELFTSDPTNFDEAGKWLPPHVRTEAQALRYARRCMPVLLADAVRASDVLICHGQRVKLNWRTEMMDDWELQPPTYKAHGFPRRQQPVRPISTSTQGSSQQNDDEITALEQTTSNLELTKTMSTLDKKLSSSQLKTRNRQRAADNHVNAMHGVVYCF